MEDRDILNEDDPYIILGLDEDASKTDIKKAYVKLIKKYKPESFPEEFKKIREAYERAIEWLSDDHYIHQMEIDYEKEKKNLNLEEGFEDSDRSSEKKDKTEKQEKPSELFPEDNPTINIDSIDSNKIHNTNDEVHSDTEKTIEEFYDKNKNQKENGFEDEKEIEIDGEEEDITDLVFEMMEKEAERLESLEDDDFEEDDEYDEYIDYIEIYKNRIKAGERFIDAARTLYDGILDDADLITDVNELLDEEEFGLFLDEYPIDWDMLYQMTDEDLAFEYFDKIIREKFENRDYLVIFDIIISDTIIESAEESKEFNEYILYVLSFLMLYLPNQVDDILSLFEMPKDFEDVFDFVSRSSKGWDKFTELYPDSPICDLVEQTIFIPYNKLTANFKRVYDFVQSEPEKAIEQFDLLKKHDLYFLLDTMLSYFISKSTIEFVEPVKKLNLTKLNAEIKSKKRFADKIYGFIYIGLLIFIVKAFQRLGWWGIITLLIAVIVFFIVAFKQSRDKYNPQRVKILRFIFNANITLDSLHSEVKVATKGISHNYQNIENIENELESDKSLEFYSKLNYYRQLLI